jgi:hypothetical protein
VTPQIAPKLHSLAGKLTVVWRERWIRCAVVLLAAVGACTRHNPAYCESSTDCANGTSCDLTSHACVPTDAMVDVAIDTPPGPRCMGLARSCGHDDNDDCCSTAVMVAGGTFSRSYDVATDGMFSTSTAVATVSSFYLDK